MNEAARNIPQQDSSLDGKLEKRKAELEARRKQLLAELAQINEDLGGNNDIIELSENDLEVVPPPIPVEAKRTTKETSNFAVTEESLADQQRQAELAAVSAKMKEAQRQEALKKAEDQIMTDLLNSINTMDEPAASGQPAESVRPPRQQILQRTDTAAPQTTSFFGKVKNAFSGIKSLFSRKDKYAQQVEDMNAMSNAEVTADVQAAAAAEAAASDARGEAYATKSDAGPSTARKVTEKVGDTLTGAFDTAQDFIQSGPTIEEPTPKMNNQEKLVADMATMSDAEVTAEVQAAAAAKAAESDARGEAYAAKSDAGPSTARKVTEKVGDTLTGAFDTAQDFIQSGPTIEEPLSEEEIVDAKLDKIQAKADMKEGKQFSKWKRAIEKRATTKEMTKMEALVDRIREINKEINAEGFGESDPEFDPRVAELHYLEQLLEEPNFQSNTANTRTAAKRALNKAKRDIDKGMRAARNVRNF